MILRAGLDRLLFVPLAAGLLASCAVGPDYAARSAGELGVPDQWSVSAPPQAEDLTRWWRNFDDPVLTQLVEQAAATNLDLEQAIARLRQARESLVISGQRCCLRPADQAASTAPKRSRAAVRP